MTITVLFLILNVLLFTALCTFYAYVIAIEKKLIDIEKEIRSISKTLINFEGRLY